MYRKEEVINQLKSTRVGCCILNHCKITSNYPDSLEERSWAAVGDYNELINEVIKVAREEGYAGSFDWVNRNGYGSPEAEDYIKSKVGDFVCVSLSYDDDTITL